MARTKESAISVRLDLGELPTPRKIHDGPVPGRRSRRRSGWDFSSRLGSEANGKRRYQAEVEKFPPRARNTAQGFGRPRQFGEPRHDIPSRRVGREGGQNDRSLANEKAGGRDRPRAQDGVNMPRNRAWGIDRAMAMTNRPAGHFLSLQRASRRAGVVVAGNEEQAHMACVQPAGQAAKIFRGATTGKRRFNKVASDNKPVDGPAAEKGRELRQRLGERVGRQAVAPGGACPFIAEMDVGNDRGSFGEMNGRPFGRKEPAVGSREARRRRVGRGVSPNDALRSRC